MNQYANNYVPKHRSEPVAKHRITVMETERGWGSDSWYEYFDSEEDAQDRINFINSQNKPGAAPAYYTQAYTEIEKVIL